MQRRPLRTGKAAAAAADRDQIEFKSCATVNSVVNSGWTPMIYFKDMIILVILLALLAVGVVYLDRHLQRSRGPARGVKVSWANIDVLLKQRHDELPKLIDTCKRYMQYEQETLEKVMRARNSVSQAQASGDVAGVGAGEQRLRAGMGQLFAVAENYPQLKSDETFRDCSRGSRRSRSPLPTGARCTTNRST